MSAVRFCPWPPSFPLPFVTPSYPPSKHRCRRNRTAVGTSIVRPIPGPHPSGSLRSRKTAPGSFFCPWPPSFPSRLLLRRIRRAGTDAAGIDCRRHFDCSAHPWASPFGLATLTKNCSRQFFLSLATIFSPPVCYFVARAERVPMPQESNCRRHFDCSAHPWASPFGLAALTKTRSRRVFLSLATIFPTTPSFFPSRYPRRRNRTAVGTSIVYPSGSLRS